MTLLLERIFILLTQRRIWISIIGGSLFVLSVFGVKIDIDHQTLAELLVNLVSAIGGLVSAVLALHSFFKPKSN